MSKMKEYLLDQYEREGEVMNKCELCDNNADFRTVEGSWFVCKECVVSGKSDGIGA